MSNCVLQSEYERAAVRTDALDAWNGRTILITGATGLIGAQLVNTILCYNRLRAGEVRVIALARNARKIQNVFGHLLARPELKVINADVTGRVEISEPVDAIIHLASVTASKEFVRAPVDTMRTLYTGTDNLLSLAREKRAASFVYASSLEVYGIPPKYDVAEGDYGYIDPLCARSSYSEGKRMAECLCAAYYAQYGVPVRIARLTQTIGAGVGYDDSRVFAQFARSVIERNDIVLNTSGATVRSYIDILDAVSAIFTLLTRGAPGEAYNAANMHTAISIADMARLVCALFPESGINLRFNRPSDISALGYNPEMKISLDSRKLESLGWRAEIPLEDTFRRLVEGLRQKRPGARPG